MNRSSKRGLACTATTIKIQEAVPLRAVLSTSRPKNSFPLSFVNKNGLVVMS